MLSEPATLAYLREQRNERCHHCFTPLPADPVPFHFERDPKLRLGRAKDSDAEAVELFCSDECHNAAADAHNAFLSSPVRAWPSLVSSMLMVNRIYPLMVARLFASIFLNLMRTGRVYDPTNELIWNRNTREDSVTDYGLVKKYLLTEPGQAELLNLNFFLAKVSTLNMNAVSISLPGHGGEMDRVGTALFLQSSLLNHSCVPNLDISFTSGESHGHPDRALRLNAISNRDIEAGEQLFISYVDADTGEFADGENRRAWLRAAYGFECRCPRCLGEGVAPI